VRRAHRGHHCRRRRAPCFVCNRCRLNAPSLSSHTPRAYTRTCCPGRTACSLEHGFPRPPSSSRRRAHCSARSKRPPTLLAPSLGHVGAFPDAHCPTVPSLSPDFAPPRSCCPCSAAAARRRSLRTNQARLSREGEPNRTSVRVICQPRAHITSGELPSDGRGIFVRVLDSRAWLLDLRAWL
jgi:hypothetical protein